MITNLKTKIVKIVSDYPRIFKNTVAVINYHEEENIEWIARVKLIKAGLDDAIVRYIQEENVLVINKVLGK